MHHTLSLSLSLFLRTQVTTAQLFYNISVLNRFLSDKQVDVSISKEISKLTFYVSISKEISELTFYVSISKLTNLALQVLPQPPSKLSRPYASIHHFQKMWMWILRHILLKQDIVSIVSISKMLQNLHCLHVKLQST